MKAEIESIVCNWADEILHILVRVINAITLSANEEELRTAVKRIAEETELDKFFAYGWRTSFLAYPPQVIKWRTKGTQIIKG